MLHIDDLSASYGEAKVLTSASLTVAAGEVVTLCGRNGAGKTTLLRCVMGLHPFTGKVSLDGQDLRRRKPFERARLGLGWVPDDRGAYATLTVGESLTLPPMRGGWSLEQIYEAFPNLYARRNFMSTKLSGGEQQMLALARALRMGSRLLLCDEPTEGLAPLLVQRVGEILRQAKQQSIAVLLVEQNLHFAAEVADSYYLLASGSVQQTSPEDKDLLTYLGV